MWRRSSVLQVALCLLVSLLYAPCLRGGFLNWDDPWLVEGNTVARRGVDAFVTICSDFSKSARMTLGAEYLPVRDVSWWLEEKIHGLAPTPLHVTNVLLYLCAVLVF